MKTKNQDKGGGFVALTSVDQRENYNLLTLDITQNMDDAALEATYSLDYIADGEEYIFLPACCYDGNRFSVLKKEYPPMFSQSEAAVDMPVTITDVIRLAQDGTGKIQVTAGDMSVPCIGIFSKKETKATFIFTVQEINGINLGMTYEKGKIGIQYPHFRQGTIYRRFKMEKRDDDGLSFTAGEKIKIPFIIHTFDCADMENFFAVFFEKRKCMEMDDSLPDHLPFSRQFEILRDKFNRMNWREKERFYAVGTTEGMFDVWQPGWVGGAISSYALMKLGGKLEYERGVDTLHHLFRTQTDTGFFRGVFTADGQMLGDAYGMPGGEDWHLIRKSADVLYFLFKHFAVMTEKGDEIPAVFIDGTRKLADAFCCLWDKYHQFGQFIDDRTGVIVAGGSTSAGIAPAGLVAAACFFSDEKYLRIAKESAEQFYIRDASCGYTTGGPGEILQCPDSESAFGLLESYVILYEKTKEKKWLDYARHTANLCSSWVVPYNYHFPEKSEFSRLQMKSTGTVFANVQNKHSAPGICTLSGDSLYKLFIWTGNEKYMDMLREIALSINQYMSRKDRPIYSWDTPGQILPEGFICERVNLSDWEEESGVGGVFCGSCWSETSNLLTLAEVVNTVKIEE